MPSCDMRCRSPLAWFLQCLKNLWRMLFGRKRSGSSSGSGSGQNLLQTSISGNAPATFSGITVESLSPIGAVGPQSPPARTSAADAWRQSLLQKNSAPPEVVEEPNFFDSMAPTVHKQKIVRLRTDTDESTVQSSRLAFNAAAPVVNQFDWMEDEAPSGNWETAIDDLDPKEIRKAQRKAQSSSIHSGHQSTTRPK